MIDSAISTFTSVTNIGTTNASQDQGEKFLRFQLGDLAIALLALNSIKQVMQVSLSEILPVPQMPGCVLGIYNWRGEMLWLVDLGQMLGFPSLCDPSLEVGSQPPLTKGGDLMAIAIQIGDKTLGLVVRQINDIERHHLQQINQPSIGLFSPDIMPYLGGYLLGEEREVLMVLNGEAIANAPLWQIHKFG